MNYFYIIVFAFSFLFHFSSVKAQEASSTRDVIKTKKIGLVLSGGGARGLAHVAALKMIDSLGIKVDYVTGTSMGAVIGSLYAVGYSGKEIEKISLGTDWEMLLSNEIPYKKVSIREKEDFYKYILRLPVSRKGIDLPEGLIQGQELSLNLEKLLAKAYKIRDFSKLPIPFKCIATDLETGDVVALDTGSLATSVRASMSIPSVFTPVKINRKLLADGGLVRNLPVSEIKEMGADLVIGVNVATPDYTLKNLDSFVKILLQSSSFINNQGLKKQISMCDYYIDFAPILSQNKISSSDFVKVDEIINTSNEYVQKYEGEFSELKQLLVEEQIPVREIKLATLDSVYISSIKILGFEGFNSKFVLKNSGFRTNQSIAIESIQTNIQQLYGTGFFDKIIYELEAINDKDTRLILKANQKPRGLLQLAPYFNNDDEVSLTLNFTMRNKVGQNSKQSASFFLSQNPILNLHLMKYRGNQLRFTDNLRIRYENTLIPLPDFEYLKFKELRSNFLSVNFFSTFMPNPYYQLGIGLGLKSNWNKIFLFKSEKSVGDSYVDFNNQLLDLNLFWKFNNQDAFIFPSKGFKVQLEASYNWVLGQHKSYNHVDESDLADVSGNIEASNYFRFRFDFERYYKLHSKLSLFWSAGVGYSVGGQNGLLPFWFGSPNEYRNNQVSFFGLNAYATADQQYSKFGLGLQYSPWDKLFIIPQANILVHSKEFKNLYQITKLNSENHFLGYGFSLAHASLIGPVSVSLMRSTLKRDFIVYFNIGFSI